MGNDVEAKVNEIVERITIIDSLFTEKLGPHVGQEDNEASLRRAHDLWRRTAGFLGSFSVEAYTVLPDGALDDVANYLRQLADQLKAGVRHSDTFGTARGVAHLVFVRLASLAFLYPEGLGAMRQLEPILASAQRIESDATATLKRIQGLEATATVAHLEKNFDTTAAAHEQAATPWAIGAGSAIVLVVVVAALSYFFPPRFSEGIPTGLAEAAARIVIVGALYFASVVCLRNYRAHRHLHVVNTHRRNALKTFETFAKAATDEETKKVILLAASGTISLPCPLGIRVMSLT